MRIESIQIGTPRTVGSPGAAAPMERSFTSAIWKRPVAGEVKVGRLGLEGDAVANRRVHGGQDQAVLMYAASHYPLWRSEWSLPDLEPGAFGENLTVTELTEDTTYVGDVLEAGTARFQVSKPREPCSTLARRHQVRDMIAVVNANGRSGWYLRVLREGRVEAGDALTLLDRPHPEWSVRRAAQVMLGRAHRLEEAAMLAECAALADGWRRRLAAASAVRPAATD